MRSNTNFSGSAKYFFKFLLVSIVVFIVACGSSQTILIATKGSGTIEGYVNDKRVFECKTFCNFNQTLRVTLIAEPDPGATFIEWRGTAVSKCGSDPVCMLELPLQNVNEVVGVFSNKDEPSRYDPWPMPNSKPTTKPYCGDFEGVNWPATGYKVAQPRGFTHDAYVQTQPGILMSPKNSTTNQSTYQWGGARCGGYCVKNGNFGPPVCYFQ